MKKIFLLSCLILLGLGLWIDNSLLVSASRKIASTQDDNAGAKASARLGDLSDLKGNEFLKAFKYALIQNAHALADENQVGFSFGNFLMAGSEGGQKTYVCNQYPFVELSFVADGIAFSGEAPRLIVRGVCDTAAETMFIEALKIPYRDILALPLNQQEFVPAATEAHQRIKIEFRNIVDQWPRQWNLVGVRLYDDRGQSLSLDGYEIISILGQPLTMEWGD